MLRCLRHLLVLWGLVFIGILVLPLTPVPWTWYRSMGLPGTNAKAAPEYIVMLGGGGIPSESGLMRSWKTAEAARYFPSARIVVAIPAVADESDVKVIEAELILRGIAKTRLMREPTGRNTREQAMASRALLPDKSVVGLVTSPEHMKRAWWSFRKAGFTELVAIPSWPEAIASNLDYDEKELGAPSLGGLIGKNTMIKYRYWDNLGILVKCTRETVAMWYYKLMRWG